MRRKKPNLPKKVDGVAQQKFDNACKSWKKVKTVNANDIDDFNAYLITNQDKTTVMDVNGLKATFHMPPAVRRELLNDGTEKAMALPPGNPRPAFKVDEYPGCPVSWEHGSAKASSYFVPVKSNTGMWIDMNANFSHTHHVAAVISVQGVNPLTGKKTDVIRLEQYKENCPVHNEPFQQDLFCQKCKHKWPAQNYISTTGTPNGYFWLDGFMASDGVVRQWIFTEEELKGVASQIIGKDRVHAIGIAFYLSKNPKPLPASLPTRSYSGGLGGFSLTSAKINNVAPSSLEFMKGSADSDFTLLSGGDSVVSASCNVIPCGGGSTAGVSGSSVNSVSKAPEKEEKTSGGIPLPDEFTRASRSGNKKSAARTRSSGSSTDRSLAGQEMNKTFNRFYSTVHPVQEVAVKKLEVGAGARIDQQIHRDPENLDFWRDEPVGFIYVNYTDIASCKAIIEAGKREEKTEGFLDDLKLAN